MIPSTWSNLPTERGVLEARYKTYGLNALLQACTGLLIFFLGILTAIFHISEHYFGILAGVWIFITGIFGITSYKQLHQNYSFRSNKCLIIMYLIFCITTSAVSGFLSHTLRCRLGKY